MTHTPLAKASTADLVRLASAQFSALVRDELLLARTEMKTKAKNAGAGAGMLGAAGVLAAYAAGALFVGIGLLLALVLPGWVAAFVVCGVLLLFAALLALVGRSRVGRAVPPVPGDALSEVRADVAEMTGAYHRSRGSVNSRGSVHHRGSQPR